MKTDEKIEKILVTVTRMEGHVDRNTADLAHHIKRTNIMESKLQKMVYLLLIGAGIGVALYGPNVLKIMGILL